MEDREAWRFFHEGEKIQFLTQLAMVAALRFFQQVQVFIQRFLLRETRAVDALQHFVVFITAPVCTGNAHELDRLDHARFWQMWASAEIHILAVLIEADRFIFRQIFDKLHLVGFAAVGKEFDRFFARQLLAFKHSASLDDLLHFLFDLVQIFRHKRVRAVKVIVKTVFDRWPNGDLRTWPETLHRFRQHMAGRMTENFLTFFVVKGEDRHLSVLIEHRRKILHFAVHLCSDGFLWQTVRQTLGNFHWRNLAGIVFANAAIW